MYVETDFLLALITDEDWLGEAAETVYREYRDELWTSQFTLVELLLVAYREGRDAETVVTAATYVEDHGFIPFDALHLVESDGETIVSSDGTYESFAPRLDLKAAGDE